ncbi:MAG: NAD+ synthase [Promethearchaeota archaeon]
MKVALAQMNSTVGDLGGNSLKIKDFIKAAVKLGVDIIVFPELAITGYPPQDLLLDFEFIRQNRSHMLDVTSETEGLLCILGFVDYDNNRNLYNSAAVIFNQKLIGTVYKTLLPTYDVFDEDRYFKANKKSELNPLSVKLHNQHLNLGIEICEDLWDEYYDLKVTDLLVARGADVIINLSASPFYAGKRIVRENLLRDKAIKNNTPIFYVNSVGGQDELVFDGYSFAVDRLGDLIGYAKQFEEELVCIDLDLDKMTADKIVAPPFHREEEIFNALVLGIRDYFRKTGFHAAVIGMSGGIDSSLTTCLAVDALGHENVIGISMPSKYSSGHSKTDAQMLAENLGICFLEVPIQCIVDAYQSELNHPLQRLRDYYKLSAKEDNPIADENIQPRVRGNILMDISNRLGKLKILVLNTGNKTELALGYCTLYGDMSGGLSAIGDVSKIDVYKLAHYYNKKEGKEIIPHNVFIKKPSAELKEGQFDPFNYDIISPLVDEIIENRLAQNELIAMGYPKDIVLDTLKKITLAEYKRWQAPPCIKITQKAFGTGRKMPIVNKYIKS